jgi:5-amino-6-(5-phosphoribosylamino)uracil reductase
VDRPYVLLSCAMSLDGYIDDRTDQPLRLSGEADIDRVDELRASCDAILIGAATVRSDDPLLMLRSQRRRDARTAAGLSPDPLRVVVSGSGDLDPHARLLTVGGDTVVYVASSSLVAATEHLANVAEVADAGDPLELDRVLADLTARGVRRLLVEGGGSLHTQFLTAGLADELQLSVAPFFVGDSAAPRFVGDGRFPWNSAHRARLTEVASAGDMAVLRYALSSQSGP